MTTTKKTQTVPAASAPMPPPAPPASPPAPADPSAALLALALQAITQLDALEAQLGADPPTSPATKRHSARMRKGGAEILGIIATLAAQHQLEPPAKPASFIGDETAKANALQPLSNRLAAFRNHVDDLIFQAQSAAWGRGLELYGVMKRSARSNNDLATALQPVTQFFAYRHTLPKPVGTPTKPQRKATTKAVGTLKKNAPELLAAPSPVTEPAPVTVPALAPALPKA